nr:MAG: hypothetical protein [Bacteriophage sp.]
MQTFKMMAVSTWRRSIFLMRAAILMFITEYRRSNHEQQRAASHETVEQMPFHCRRRKIQGVEKEVQPMRCMAGMRLTE